MSGPIHWFLFIKLNILSVEDTLCVLFVKEGKICCPQTKYTWLWSLKKTVITFTYDNYLLYNVKTEQWTYLIQKLIS